MQYSRPVASEKPKQKVSIGDEYDHPNGILKVTQITGAYSIDKEGQKLSVQKPSVLFSVNGHGDHGCLSLDFFLEKFGDKKRPR